jgi:hypothetical protein
VGTKMSGIETVLRSMKWKIDTDTKWPKSVAKAFAGETEDHAWVSCCIVSVEGDRIHYQGAIQSVLAREEADLTFELAEIAVSVAERQLKESKHGKA